jgi:hypothetical protein
MDEGFNVHEDDQLMAARAPVVMSIKRIKRVGNYTASSYKKSNH